MDDIVAAMKKQTEPTKSEGLRLTVIRWAMLRELMTHHKGRSWLERIIAREHKKIV